MFSLEGEDKVAHCSVIVLGVSTLGMSVLLWKLFKYCSDNDKDDVEGTVCMNALHMYVCYVCIFLYVCIYVSMYVCYVCTCVYMFLYACMYECILILCTHYTAHSAVPLSSTKSAKKYVIVHTHDMYVCTHIHIDIHTYVLMYVCVCMYICTYTYECMYVCMYVCMYIRL